MKGVINPYTRGHLLKINCQWECNVWQISGHIRIHIIYYMMWDMQEGLREWKRNPSQLNASLVWKSINGESASTLEYCDTADATTCLIIDVKINKYMCIHTYMYTYCTMLIKLMLN